jgi:hypothetical protein
MLRAVALLGGSLLVAGTALAAADIPTRYSGSFPSTANMRNISGTFTGKSLSLRGTAGGRALAVAGRYTCTNLSATQTRCSGTLKSNDGSYSDNHIVTISWSGGRPVAMSGAH